MDPLTRCTSFLICPICGGGLRVADGALECDSRHTFNRARAGYTDLLPQGHGLSKVRGDTIEMIEARRRIAERGHLDAVHTAVADIAAAHLHDAASGGAVPAVLDAGCGEGSYLRSVMSAAEAGGADICALGFDVSRDALRLAAPGLPGACFFVNDVKHRITVRSGSMHVILNTFAPRNRAEFTRVLHPDGRLVVVIPAPEHLAELRAFTRLLDIDAGKSDQVQRQLSPDFTLDDRRSVRCSVTAGPADAADLVRMSPSSWHTDITKLESVLPGEALEVSVAAEILVLRRV